MSKQQKSFFWASYADLMTTLFFIMLMLFVSTIVILNRERKAVQDELRKTEAEKQQLEQINNAIQGLDSTYFDYVVEYKKHKLKIPVNFVVNDYHVSNLKTETREALLDAGRKLQMFVKQTISENPNIQYLLIIEGQASKIGGSEHNYLLSYERAYNLKTFWEDNGIKFTASNCEVIISGSGDGVQSGTALMRESVERQNQRFLIHIIPKPGYVKTNEVK